jgi:acetylornithine/N-succinyldiaminopimelate aminotransferase
VKATASDHLTLDEARRLEQEFLIALYGPIRQGMIPVRGEGALLWDAQGREYLDLASGGRAVTGVGHCHPRVVAAIKAQAERLIHCSNDFYTEPMLRLAERLGSLSPCRKVFFCNSGAEANEAAIKLARKHASLHGPPGKREIVTALDSFHGRTLATLTATGQPKYQKGFEPLASGFAYVPYNDSDAMERAVGDNTCAVMLEPVLGEAGVYPATPEHLAGVRRLCDERGALLILDEVQTGMGRTGAMFAFQRLGVTPDMFTLAKGLAGGVPMGAMLARDEVAASFEPGDHATTFGGSPLPAAAALAVLDAIEEEGLIENARVIGEHLVGQLRAMQSREPDTIAQIRGCGMMVGVDLAGPWARDVRRACLGDGVIIQAVGDRILRLIPPLVLTRVQADRGLEVIERSIVQARERNGP